MLYQCLLLIAHLVSVCTSTTEFIRETHFKIDRNTRSQLEVTRTYDALSETQCSRLCISKQGCSAMNFNGDTDELLEFTDNVFEILVNDGNWKFLCE